MSPLSIPRQLFAAASLSLLGGLAQAGGLSLKDELQIREAGQFSSTVVLQLDQRSQVSLWLQGWSQKGSAGGSSTGALASSDLNIRGLTLKNGSTTLYFDGQPGNGSLGLAAHSTESRLIPGSKRETSVALQTFELEPLLLDAGSWTLTYYGDDESKKFASGVELRVQAQNAVAEPAALALAGLSLGLGGLLTRRRRA